MSTRRTLALGSLWAVLTLGVMAWLAWQALPLVVLVALVLVVVLLDDEHPTGRPGD